MFCLLSLINLVVYILYNLSITNGSIGLTADSWLITYPSGYSRMLNLLVFLFQRTSPWESILACGMLMTGPQEVDWWKLIGPKHPLQHTTVTSKSLSSHPGLPFQILVLSGTQTRLMLMAEGDWDGSRSTSWFITIAMISSDSHKAFLLSVDTN